MEDLFELVKRVVLAYAKVIVGCVIFVILCGIYVFIKESVLNLNANNGSFIEIFTLVVASVVTTKILFKTFKR